MILKLMGTNSAENTASGVFTFPDTTDNLAIEGDTVTIPFTTTSAAIQTTAIANLGTAQNRADTLGGFINLNIRPSTTGTSCALYRFDNKTAEDGTDGTWANIGQNNTLDNEAIYFEDMSAKDFTNLTDCPTWNPGGLNNQAGWYLIVWEVVPLEDRAGVSPNGTFTLPKFRYSGGCLQATYDDGTTWYDLGCSLATLQDALDLLALAYPTEDYDAGVDPDGFIRVQAGSGGAGTITFDQQFQELLGTYLADFWPPELWYEHVPKWL